MVLCQPQRVLQEHDRTKLRQIVFNVETVLATLNDGVTARDGDIVDADFAFVPATKFEIGFFFRDGEHVDVTTRVLVQRHRLEQDVLAAGLRLIYVNQFE